MSGKFNGFSQDDINKAKNNGVNKENAKVMSLSRPRVKRLPDRNQTRAVPQKIAPMSDHHEMSSGASSSEMDGTLGLQEIGLFRPLPQKTYPPNDESILQLQPKPDTEELEQLVDCATAEPAASTPFKGVSLKEFEFQRRIVEEQNKQKKDMLYKAIEKHSERTAAEAKKLQDIKVELTKLDSELANDVAILRRQIDVASVQFMNVQKQYEQFEAMFLRAKLDLHQASEKKELLTEHLCTIIAHNEDRKAKKLTELMAKVGLEPGELVAATEVATHNDK